MQKLENDLNGETCRWRKSHIKLLNISQVFQCFFWWLRRSQSQSSQTSHIPSALSQRRPLSPGNLEVWNPATGNSLMELWLTVLSRFSARNEFYIWELWKILVTNAASPCLIWQTGNRFVELLMMRVLKMCFFLFPRCLWRSGCITTRWRCTRSCSLLRWR